MRTIEEIRVDFDKTDREIAGLLERRMRLSEEMAAAKREQGLGVLQVGRRNEVLERWVENCPSFSRESVEGIYNIIHSESVKKQNNQK